MKQGLLNRFGTPSSGDWRGMVENMKAAREEFRQYASMMTTYERSIIERDIKEQAERAFPVVTAGAIGEWKQAIKKYQEAGKAYNREVTNEITRWDADRLNAQLQQASIRIDLAIAGGGGNTLEGGSPGIAAKLEALYSEAVQSGDIYRQRATFEVLKSALPKISGDDRMPANRLAKLSERELSALRVTDGMVAAKEAQAQALDEIMAKRQELIEVSEVLGQGDPTQPLGTGPFTRALMMVQQDRDTGEIKIYSDDEYQLIGGVFYPKNEEKEG